jgi:hypothetical protein
VSGFYRFTQNPYDLGPIGNWRYVWGTHPLALFWPFLAPRRKDQLLFPLIPKAKEIYISKEDAGGSSSGHGIHKSTSVFDFSGQPQSVLNTPRHGVSSLVASTTQKAE